MSGEATSLTRYLDGFRRLEQVIRKPIEIFRKNKVNYRSSLVILIIVNDSSTIHVLAARTANHNVFLFSFDFDKN